MDTFTPEQRHKCMAAIHNKDTKPEMCVRKYLFARGFRYRLHSSKLPGHPDLVLRKYKTVIFINGCFWHGHEGCGYFKMPQSNVEFWTEKIRRNKERDRRNQEALAELGWRCVTVWECRLRPKFREETLHDLAVSLWLSLPQKEAAPYEIPETPALIAAEPAAEYGAKSEKRE